VDGEKLESGVGWLRGPWFWPISGGLLLSDGPKREVWVCPVLGV